MYISICEVLDKRLKEAVAERHGHRVGLHWPNTVINPINEKIDQLNDATNWEDASARLQSVADLREAVLANFPHLEAQDAGQEEGVE